ncbi:retropepsin-like aspartic protease family protein [Patiriisocius marinus]|uniref:retropepsin-like aspartic protease family protein n=1 Tax=Patiriisocius marinus TaxID=1397112 RepID=UPI00232EE263|nr:retropepsin-like aspartic protease [Patiriisocius marinus]
MQLRALLEEKGFDRVPLRKMATGHYYSKVKLNGVKAIFIIDTGASTSCIGEKFISHFSLTSEESDVLAAGAGATGMKTKSSENNLLKIGSRTITDMSFVIFDLSHVNEALLQVDTLTTHGILGADFLKNKRAVIDYGRNCMYLK